MTGVARGNETVQTNLKVANKGQFERFSSTKVIKVFIVIRVQTVKRSNWTLFGQSGHFKVGLYRFDCLIQLFQLMLSEENQKAHKTIPQGNMGSLKSVFITAVKVCGRKLVIERKRTVNFFLLVYPDSSRNTKISGSNVQTFERKCILVSSDL